MKKKRYFLPVLFLGFFSFFTFSISNVLAQDVILNESGERVGIPFTPQIPIPGFSVDRVMGDGSTLANYIIAIYQYGATVAGLVAMFMLVLAGWKWLMAAGNPEKISAAKDTIQGAVVGLILLFGSYLLLAQISNRLVTFTGLEVVNVPRVNIPLDLLGSCMQEAQNHDCGSSGAFTVVYEGTDRTCPGGLRCSRSDASCVIPKGGTTYERCTMEYMISRSDQGESIDCTCVSNELRYGSRFR
ncbi:MAG: pilin [Patescibacteria group bacterium]|nr:pilin [Patescibacteria group bacterium]